MKALKKIGLKADSSSLPGRIRNDKEKLFDWSNSPNQPYFPSKNDYQKSSEVNENFVEIPMNTISTKCSYDKSHLLRYANLAFKNEVLQNGLKDYIKKRKSFLNRNGSKINLLVRSSYEPRKGCQLILDTIKKLSIDSSPQLDRLELHVIGDNYLVENGISKMIKTLSHGIVNRNRLFDLYAECDVFIVTSEEDSGPIMINECSGLGVYILSTDVGVAADLINNDNGKIYDRNSESLIESIKSLNINNIRNFSKCHLNSEDLYHLTFEKFYEEIINEIIL